LLNAGSTVSRIPERECPLLERDLPAADARCSTGFPPADADVR